MNIEKENNNGLSFCILKEKDLEFRVNTLNIDSVNFGIHIETPVLIENTLTWFKNKKSNRFDFSIKKNNEIVGFSGLVNIDPDNGLAELYIFIHPDYQKQGIGKNAVSYLIEFAKKKIRIRKLILFVNENNAPAIKLYEALNFRREALLINHVFHHGNLVNRCIYSIFL